MFSHIERDTPSPLPLPSGERMKVRGKEIQKQPSHMEREKQPPRIERG